MSAQPPTVSDVADWWATAISRVEPGVIELRGRPIQELIGTTSMVEMIWLLLRGEVPPPSHARLLEAALVAGVDHGPHAPSIAATRMAATCGVGLNGAIATGVNLLGDVHGGAGEQCLELLTEICDLAGDPAGDEAADGDAGASADAAAVEAAAADAAAADAAAADAAATDAAAAEVLARWRERSAYIPGFGHRFHATDPRRDPLLSLVAQAQAEGAVAGRHLAAALAIERALRTRDGRQVPINIDGATAVIYGELGFAPPLARGFFVLSRSIGLLAHAWEETEQGRRIKGPIPPTIVPTYLGHTHD